MDCFWGSTFNLMVGIRMFTAGIIGAISGFVIGGVIGGLVSAKQGNSFLDGLLEGSVYGLINGFTTSAILFCGSETLKAIRKPSCCFIAGTVVLTEEGNKAIEDIEVGDMVWAYNEKTGQKDLKRVVRLFRNETEEWIHINIYKEDEETSEEIICTPEHPFYIPDIGWVNASNLVENMKVLLYNGTRVKITKVTREALETPETTYNFEVEDYHTYYVSDSGVLVHNKCGEILDEVPDGYKPTFKNGKYEPNSGKHGRIPKGKISRNVTKEYGQYALDNSVSFGGKARFAYNGKEVIQFYPGSGNMANVYHGYFLDWKLINSPTLRNAVEHYFNL